MRVCVSGIATLEPLLLTAGVWSRVPDESSDACIHRTETVLTSAASHVFKGSVETGRSSSVWPA